MDTVVIPPLPLELFVVPPEEDEQAAMRLPAPTSPLATATERTMRIMPVANRTATRLSTILVRMLSLLLLGVSGLIEIGPDYGRIIQSPEPGVVGQLEPAAGRRGARRRAAGRGA